MRSTVLIRHLVSVSPALSGQVLWSVAICVALVSSLFVSTSHAQRTVRGGYKVGDKIEYRWGAEVYPGKVTAVRNGFVTITYEWRGRPHTETHPANSVLLRKAGATASKAGATPAAPGTIAATGNVKQMPARTWSDATGKFKIEASFAGKDDAGVKLKKADGQVLTVPLEKLSKEDQAFISGLLAAGVDTGAAEENPFAAAEVVAEAGAPKTIVDRPANWMMAKPIVVVSIQNATLAPDAATPLPAPTGNKVAMLAQPGAQSGRDEFFVSPTSLLFDRAAGEAIVVFVDDTPRSTREVRLTTCDMKTMKMKGEATVAIGANPVDISPSGKVIACLPDWHAPGDAKDWIEILRRDEKGLRLYRRWKMGEFNEWEKQFDILLLVDDKKLLTASKWGGVATLWDIDKAWALWTLKIQQQTWPALSANRKYMAAITDAGIAIFDSATGATLNTLAIEGSLHGTLSFSPDGTQIACLSPDTLKVWDIAQNKLVREMWFPQQMSGTSLGWLGGSFFLVDDVWLIDIDKKIVLWEYELPSHSGRSVAEVTGGHAWVVGGGHGAPYQLACITVPDAAAKQKASELSADAVLAVKPGARVSLNINLPGATEEETQKVTQLMTAQLKTNGMIIAADSPLVLEATVVDGGTETKTYSRFGFRGGGEEVTVNKLRSIVSLAENGQVLWASSGTYGGTPGVVRVADGQSVQDAVDSKKANPFGFFNSVRLPKYLARHGENMAYGKGRLTP